MLVSYVAGEGVELTVHKENVVVEEMKEVELRSRRAQFIYTWILHSNAEENFLSVARYPVSSFFNSCSLFLADDKRE